jgi:phosphatidylglycerophosphate synthase
MRLRDLPPWVVVLIVGRDVSILAGSLFLIRRHRIIPMSNVPGKVTGAALAALIIVYVVDWRPLTSVIVAVTTAALAVSAISYGAYFWGRLRGT